MLQAFSDDPARGLLHLATVELQTPLPASLGYARDLAKDYLTALEANKPKRGRRVSKVDLEKRLTQVKRDIINADPMRRLELAQQRIDLEARAGKHLIERAPGKLAVVLVAAHSEVDVALGGVGAALAD